MSPGTASKRAGVLRYAAVQFVVLTIVAMQLYGGGNLIDPAARGYAFFGNFLSDLGATRAWSGQPNHVAAVLFAIALASLGLSFVAFAGAWRAFAFGHGRARAVGIASRVFGTASGLAFVGVAATPVNVELDLHNAFVIAAFVLLFGYAASLTVVSVRNGATRVRVIASGSYLALVGAYVASTVVVARGGAWDAHRVEILVASQKAIAYVSMLYIAYLTTAARRQLAGV